MTLLDILYVPQLLAINELIKLVYTHYNTIHVYQLKRLNKMKNKPDPKQTSKDLIWANPFNQT
jgi:hypothetical protein